MCSRAFLTFSLLYLETANTTMNDYKDLNNYSFFSHSKILSINVTPSMQS